MSKHCALINKFTIRLDRDNILFVLRDVILFLDPLDNVKNRKLIFGDKQLFLVEIIPRGWDQRRTLLIESCTSAMCDGWLTECVYLYTSRNQSSAYDISWLRLWIAVTHLKRARSNVL